MASSDQVMNLGRSVEAVALKDGPAPENSGGQKDPTPTDMLRIKEQMSNQCFEMAVQLSAGQSKRSCSTFEAERELPDCVSELERLKTIHFNSRLTLHRMQIWRAVKQKLKQNDPEAEEMKDVRLRFMALCSQIKQLQQESRELHGEITEIQKKRLEMKRLMHEKMREMEELTSKKEHPDSGKNRAALEKGQANLEKYKRMAVMTQNVLRGILFACRVNWMDDPKLRAVGMTLEELPISD
ncbi:centromere protein H [Genypterus blacodes]|uniref:centromere protein H n=1 Tax=Genypterus blacodes TaxID=154954 RepID=UPI003F77151F